MFAQIMVRTTWAIALAAVTWVSAAQAVPCNGRYSAVGCFDAGSLPGPAEPSPWRLLGLSKPLAFSDLAATAIVSYSSRPAELSVASPDPNGRIIPVVDHSTRLDLRAAYGVGRGLDLLAAIPAAISQSGSGPDVLGSQRPEPLDTRAIGDPKAGVRFALPEKLESLSWSIRVMASAPLGSERAYLGWPSFTESVGLGASYQRSGWLLAADTSLNVMRPVRFGDLRLGTSCAVVLGIARRLFDDRVMLSIESGIQPMLIDSPAPQEGAGRVTWLAPAQWLGGVSWRPGTGPLLISAAAGTALALSHRDRGRLVPEGVSVDQWFEAPSIPRWRALISVSGQWTSDPGSH